MHLKNFSLIAFKNGQYQLASAYDMVAVKLVISDDPEELALNLNGKKRKLKRKDFNEAMAKAQIPERAIENLWNRIEKGMINWLEIISGSFLSNELKEVLLDLIRTRAKQIGLHLHEI
jgi:serine/threonine-protein kinase HipA